MTNQPMGARPVATGNPDLIREDIERTRDDLGETMEQLAAKADVKARTREAADQAKAQAREKAEHAKAQARERIVGRAHSVQQQSGELAHKATEGVQRARRRPAPVATAATAAGAAAAAGMIIVMRRRRAAHARARRSIWRRWG